MVTLVYLEVTPHALCCCLWTLTTAPNLWLETVHSKCTIYSCLSSECWHLPAVKGILFRLVKMGACVCELCLQYRNQRAWAKNQWLSVEQYVLRIIVILCNFLNHSKCSTCSNICPCPLQSWNQHYWRLFIETFHSVHIVSHPCNIVAVSISGYLVNNDIYSSMHHDII